jgi:hypothetical protein
VGDPRNKLRKLLDAEGDKRRLAALAAYCGPPEPQPNRPPNLRCDGCGMDG